MPHKQVRKIYCIVTNSEGFVTEFLLKVWVYKNLVSSRDFPIFVFAVICTKFFLEFTPQNKESLFCVIMT